MLLRVGVESNPAPLHQLEFVLHAGIVSVREFPKGTAINRGNKKESDLCYSKKFFKSEFSLRLASRTSLENIFFLGDCFVMRQLRQDEQFDS